MVDPDNEERLLKIPPHVVQAIRAEALQDAIAAVEAERDYRRAQGGIPGPAWTSAIAAIKAVIE